MKVFQIIYCVLGALCLFYGIPLAIVNIGKEPFLMYLIITIVGIALLSVYAIYVTFKKKIIVFIPYTVVISALVLALAIPFSVLWIRSAIIDNDYSYVLKDEKIEERQLDVPVIKQKVSCGYAIIEMISSFYKEIVTEQQLYERNNSSITTQTTDGFVNELNNSISDHHYSAYQYLKNDEMLLKIASSIKDNQPVAIEWAAKDGNEWTLHWSLVVGLDSKNVYVNNPYGYRETISYEEFFSRTTFKAFDNMPLGYQFGFAYGLFNKNTIIIADL